jgi:phage terminase small subunit
MLKIGRQNFLKMLYFVVSSSINPDDMAILRNPRWERFAQELAGGTTAGQAYELAGFSPNPANAWRLHQREEIGRRIDEILDQKQRAADKAVENAAEKAGVDAFWVMRRLRTNSVLAARRGDTAASNRAAELIGKHIGMFIEKKQIEISYIDDADEYLAKILEVVGQPVIEHEPLEDAEARRAAAYQAANERHPLPISGTSDGPSDGSEPGPEADAIDIIEEVT